MDSWALVTGASSGIGESFTRLLAAKGYNVVLVARDLPRLQERAKGLEERFNISTDVIQADLATDHGSLQVENYISSHQIDVLINNAGFGVNKRFTRSALVDEQQALDVLVRTPVRLMHVALPLMIQRNKGVVINVSSVAGFIAGGSYSAAKSYLTVLSESLNTELSGTQVKMSALCPGFTRTEFHQRAKMSVQALPNFVWLSSDHLVEKAWRDALKGRAISVPGWQYKALRFIITVIPRSLVRKLGVNLRAKPGEK